MPETGITKAWSERKGFSSVGLSISLGAQKNHTKSPSHFLSLKTAVSEILHRYILLIPKKTFPFSPLKTLLKHMY